MPPTCLAGHGGMDCLFLNLLDGNRRLVQR